MQHFLQRCLCTLFILNRSPYLEDITPETFLSVSQESDDMRQMCWKITKLLPHLQECLPEPANRIPGIRYQYNKSDMAQEWYNWCMAWYQNAVDLSPKQQQSYTLRLLAIGRWLYHHAPEIREPEQWTEDIALHFRNDVCSWTIGQYGSERGKHIHQLKGALGHPMKAQSIEGYLNTLRRFLTDLMKWSLSVGGAPAKKIRLDFAPREVLSTPKSIRQALDVAEPRDIDLHVWARLVIAAATLSQSDLPSPAWYPLNLYRALGLLWVTSARRPNEIVRLRIDCIREEWSPEMRDDEGHPLENMNLLSENKSSTEQSDAQLFYLYVPTGKSRGAFWIWIPDYVVQAIQMWKNERPPHQRKILDQKDREYVDYLFCYRDAQVGDEFLNRTIIPTLCKKAGVDIQDAKGRISGHRGRSTRLTLLRRNGVSLDDLAEYAGHTNTKTIRRYARHHPLQLHRIIRDADDLSRIIEGVVDVQAAAQGLPALRWFIGYDADGVPQYCANQVYHTCPHRLDCQKCGMFIGGEKAKLLHEGENTLPISSKVPMTPIETCVVNGDEGGAKVCQAALQEIPTPETPDIHLIFNPEGLSNDELERLAKLGTREARQKLHQAVDAHQTRLSELQQQHKTGRNALVNAQRKRIVFLQKLLGEEE